MLVISLRVEGLNNVDKAARRDGYLSVSDSCISYPQPSISRHCGMISKLNSRSNLGTAAFASLLSNSPKGILQSGSQWELIEEQNQVYPDIQLMLGCRVK